MNGVSSGADNSMADRSILSQYLCEQEQSFNQWRLFQSKERQRSIRLVIGGTCAQAKRSEAP
jgi:hypothetical protein